VSALGRHGGAHARAIAAIVVAMGLFSLSDVFAKRLAAAGVPVVEIVWLRYVALALTIAWQLRRLRPLRRPRRPAWQALRGLGVALSALLFNVGLALLPVGTATTLVFSSPLFIAMLTVLVLRERVTVAHWSFVLLGFCGVVIAANPDPAAFDVAAIFPIAAGAAWAIAMIATRLVAVEDDAFTTQACSCAIGLCALGALVDPTGFVVPTAAQATEVAAMGLLWAAAQWLVAAAYAGAVPATVAPFAYSQLVWAHALGFALLRQVPEPAALAGSVVITAAGLAAARFARRQPPGNPATVN
jgi:drug/metabolite transporter (DMT)-like permease